MEVQPGRELEFQNYDHQKILLFVNRCKTKQQQKLNHNQHKQGGQNSDFSLLRTKHVLRLTVLDHA